MTTYTREGDEILAHEEGKPHWKVAVIDKNGQLRMAKNQADHREGVEAFLKESGEEEEDHDPKWEDSRDEASDPHFEESPSFAPSKPAAATSASDRSIPPCPLETPEAGDKTPAVVAWWFEHHPEEAERKYAGRKVARP